MAVIHQISIK